MMGAPEGRHTMSHSYVQNHLHVVFSTKERKKLIAKQIQPKPWSYLAGIARNHDFLVIANGGMGRPRSRTDAADSGPFPIASPRAA